MNNDIAIGVIGLGNRGFELLKDVMLPQGVRVIAVSDSYEDRRRRAAEEVERQGQAAPCIFEDYHKILEMDEVEAIVVTASWDTHIRIACEAMRKGKYVAIEVGGAYCLEDCWELVRTKEETGSECMLMENCNYGRDELLVLNMVKQGIFGDVIFCSGGYHHDLREEVANGRENRHYRFRNYVNRNCENYPTHELGPIASVLGINRGNRMVSLVSVSSRSAGLHEYLMKEKGASYDACSMDFRQGDVINTIIKCAHGETISLTLDTTLPRYYSRAFHVQGTKGMYEEENKSIFLDTAENHADEYDWNKHWGNVQEYYEKYEHPVWKKYLKEGIKGEHDGIDWLVFHDFFDAVRNKTAVPIDVYDAATWMSIAPLSEDSIATGMPVAIPDFTRGQWMFRNKWDPISPSLYE